MSDFSLLLNHPDRDEIISKLVSGSSYSEIYNWLKLKYAGSDQGHLRLTKTLLKEFSESPYLTDYYGQFKKDLTQVKSWKSGQVNKLSDAILNNAPYKERLIEMADKELDWTKMLEGLIAVCFQRVEQVFDTIQQNPTSFKGDNYLLRYLAEVTSAVERLKKIDLFDADQSDSEEVTTQALEAQTAFIQEVLRKVLAQIDPDTAMLFMDAWNETAKELKPPAPLSQDQKIKEAKIIEAKFTDLDDFEED